MLRLNPRWAAGRSPPPDAAPARTYAPERLAEACPEADSRLAIDAGYGFGLPGSRGVLTPYAGMMLGDAGDRTVRTGARWQLGPDTVVGLEATRQTSDASEAANEVMLRAALRF